jgi:zinc transport system substrate-binding protein
VLRQLVPPRVRHARQGALERLVVEHLDASAVFAYEVVVVLSTGERRLEAGHAAPEVDAVHEAELCELLEDAVDTRDPDLAAVRAEAVEDLLRRHAAVLPLEVLDDGVSRAACPCAGAAKLASHMVAPARGRVHFADDSDSQLCLWYKSVAMRARIVLIFALVALGGAGCGGSDDTGSDTRIVAAFYPLAYLAERVAPDAEVANVTPPGAEPHDLELSARDVEDLDDADLVLYLGGGFQPALEDAVAGHADALDLLDGQELLEGAGEHGHEGEEAGAPPENGQHADGLDPHVWLDPMRFAGMARRVAEATGGVAEAAGLVSQLEALDAEFRAGLAGCERREIVTSHAAFGYLARAYDLTQVSLTGISPEAEPSPRDLEELVAEVEEEGATTVFFETLVSPRLAETVARETGADVDVLNPLEGLTEEEIDEGADYFSVMRENLDALRRSLGCR